MKTCPRCGFHHADPDTRCVRCGGLLDPAGSADPLAGADSRLETIAPLARLGNWPLRWLGAVRGRLFRLRVRLVDPLPLGLPARNPWTTASFSLALPGLGQLRNHQPRKACLFLLGWLGWIVLAAATFFDPVSNKVLLGGVILLTLAWHDAFLIALRINRFGEPIPWQHRFAFYFAWICYFGVICTAIIWIGYWGLFRRVHIYHNELAPWLRQGEWIVMDRLTYLWREPRVGDIVYYKPGTIRMEEVGAIQSRFLTLMPVSMIERIVAGPGQSFEYRDGAFYRDGRRVPPTEQPLRNDQIQPFRIDVPPGRFAVLFTYTGAGFDPLPIHSLESGGFRQVAPPLNAPGGVVTILPSALKCNKSREEASGC